MCGSGGAPAILYARVHGGGLSLIWAHAERLTASARPGSQNTRASVCRFCSARSSAAHALSLASWLLIMLSVSASR